MSGPRLVEVAAGVGLAALIVWSLRRRPTAASRPDAIEASKPDPVPAAPSQGNGPGLTRAFDAIFAQHGRGIPVAYLRALGHAESGLRADDPRGLVNVVSIALADYNWRHPAAPIEAARLRDPIASVTVAADILRTVITSYARHHPDVVNLREDWSNPRFIELLTAGWNAGFSERTGVGRVVARLVARGPGDITVDDVFAAARDAGAASTLTNPAKLAFAKKVAASYARELAR